MKFYKIENNRIAAFYDAQINYKDITPDMIEISDDVWQALLVKQAQGYTLCCLTDGTPLPKILKPWEYWDGSSKVVDLNKYKAGLKETVKDKKESHMYEGSIEYTDASDVKHYMKTRTVDKTLLDGTIKLFEMGAKTSITWKFTGAGVSDYFVIDDMAILYELFILFSIKWGDAFEKEGAVNYMIDQLTTENVSSFDLETAWENA